MKKNNHTKKDIPLIFTVALKAELPSSIKSLDSIAVATMAQLKSEGAKVLKKKIAIIITGVGREASKIAAEWILHNLSCQFVVNIGSAGILGSKKESLQWVMPQKANNAEKLTSKLDQRTPFPWPKELKLYREGTILTAISPIEGDSSSYHDKFDYVDMECGAQNEVFLNSDVSFHTIKFLTDRANRNTRKDFQHSLKKMHQDLEAIFSFARKEEQPSISVIIPVFNREKRIKDSIESVLNQTLSPKEIIVIDDGSTDNTKEVLEKYKDQITIIESPNNKGVSAARNIGIDAAKGDWITLLDSDDLWEKDKLAKQWQYIKENPQYEIIQCDEIWIRNNVRVNSCKHHKKRSGWIFDTSLERCFISPSAVLLKKELFHTYGNFDETLPACEDYDIWLRITRHQPIGLNPEPSLIKHGGHDDQLSRKYAAMDRFRIQALQAALNREVDKNNSFGEMITNTIKKKATILAAGARKRGKEEEVFHYNSLLDNPLN